MFGGMQVSLSTTHITATALPFVLCEIEPKSIAKAAPLAASIRFHFES